MSKYSVKAVLDRLRDIEFDLGTIDNYSDDELYSMFFPTKYESENLYFKVDYYYLHNELKKPSVNLIILWDEYKDWNVLCITIALRMMLFYFSIAVNE